MKLIFNDKSYVECRKSNDKILLIISASDQNDIKKRITNAVEITIDEFQQLIADINK